jgi:CDP-diacylglycerol--serine O-phosphatidyltransferase
MKHSPKVSPIYLLPSIITLIATFCGFFAIVASISGDFFNAGIATLLAMIFDSLDGRIARLTGTTSEFGVELDSLSDMVSFGVAPSMIIFNWNLHSYGKLGWVLAFSYCACTALRLARFNIKVEVADKKFFQGLPCPSAAALVVGYVFLATNYNFSSRLAIFIGAAITLFAGISMVSNIPFYSFKEFNFHQKAPFRTILVALLIILSLAYNPEFFYIFIVLYSVSGYLSSTYLYLTKKSIKGEKCLK